MSGESISGKGDAKGLNPMKNKDLNLTDHFGEQKTYSITIDLSSSKPIYMQIVDSVVMQIAVNLLLPGSRLPSSRQLSSQLGVNYHTVNRAYTYLIQEGYVYLDRRKKVIVKEIPEAKLKTLDGMWRERIRTLLNEAISKGFEPSEIILEISSLLGDISRKSDE